MKDLQNPYKKVRPFKRVPNISEEEVFMINPPTGMVLKAQHEALDYVKKAYGVEAHAIKDRNSVNVNFVVTWDQWCKDCAIVYSALRKNVEYNATTTNHGKPFFTSVAMMIDTLPEHTITAIANQCMEYQYESMPDFTELTEEKAVELIDGLVGENEEKKKTSKRAIDSFGFGTRMDFINILASQLSSARKENSQNTMRLNRLQKQLDSNG